MNPQIVHPNRFLDERNLHHGLTVGHPSGNPAAAKADMMPFPCLVGPPRKTSVESKKDDGESPTTFATFHLVKTPGKIKICQVVIDSLQNQQ